MIHRKIYISFWIYSLIVHLSLTFLLSFLLNQKKKKLFLLISKEQTRVKSSYRSSHHVDCDQIRKRHTLV